MVPSHEWMQITSLYGGPVEFLFVLESTEDPAYGCVSSLISNFKVYMFLRFLYTFLFTYALVILRRNIPTYLFYKFCPKGRGRWRFELVTSASRGVVLNRVCYPLG
jgi:hypothetical protein